jgi:glucose/arabinose dehydrogenase
MAFAPDGRLFFTTKGGFRGDAVAHVRIVEAGKLRDQPFLSTLVATDGERGLLGIALDPDFATNHYVYVYQTMPAHTTGTGYIANRVVRYTEDPATQTAIPGSATVLLDVPSNAQNQPSTIHNGGNLHFGPDGKLYITIGDGGRIPANAQNRGNLMGKIHRLNPDGSVPGDNPFVGDPATVPSIWSYGHRNSFDFAFDPLSHQLFFTENGPACDDKVHRGVAGGNYGWPNECGTVPPGAIAPLYRYPVPIGITGIEFYGGPIEAWHNTLFWCAINTKRLYHARLNDVRSEIASVQVVNGAPVCAGDVLSGPEGALYFSEGATIFRIRLSRSSAPSSPVNSVRNSACRSSK